jgi:hypothetical protein
LLYAESRFCQGRCRGAGQAPAHVHRKAGKNTGLYQKNSFFCEKTALMFLFVFFALFARAMCGAGKGVLGDFCVFNGKFANIFLISTTFFIGSEIIRPIANNL